MSRKQFHFTPRGMSAEAAAFYIGISVSKFYEEVKKHPDLLRPTRIDGRVVWYRERLDAYMDLLDGVETPPEDLGAQAWLEAVDA